METKEYRTIDKTSWPRGEWDDEPDKMQWQDEATGLPCLIVRGPVGALCGYVGVPEGHPHFGKDYNDCTPLTPLEENQHYIDVHGGLTYADACQATDDESRHICHVPSPGEPDHVWWFGFDCAHAGDLCPKYWSEERYAGYGYESYRSLAYVKREVARLARQLQPSS